MSHSSHHESSHGHHEAAPIVREIRIGIDEEATLTVKNPDGELVQFFSYGDGENPESAKYDAWVKSIAVNEPDKFKSDNLPKGYALAKQRLIELGWNFENPYAQAVLAGTPRPAEHSIQDHDHQEEVLDGELIDEEAQETGEDPHEDIVIEEEPVTTPESNEDTQEKIRTKKVREFFQKTGRGAVVAFKTVRQATVPRVAHAGAHKVGDGIGSTSDAIEGGMATLDTVHDNVTDRARRAIEEFPYVPGVQIEHAIKETLLSANIAADNATRVVEAGIDLSREFLAEKFNAAKEAMDDKLLRIMDYWLRQYDAAKDKRDIRRKAKDFIKNNKKLVRDIKKGVSQYEINEQVKQNVIAIRAYIASKHPAKQPRYRKYEEEKASWIDLP